MRAKKKVTKKKVRTPDDLKTLELLNKSANVCRDCLEGGSPPTHVVNDFQGIIYKFGSDKGYERDSWYGDFQ